MALKTRAGPATDASLAKTRESPGLREAAVVWTLFAIVALEVLVTYARVPAHELYHVSGSGLEGGASRALVFLNFSTALAAIAILALVVDRRPQLTLPALVSLGLCAVVFWPGVVSQADLDARPVNALPAAGVALALVLTVLARGGAGGPARGDRARVVLAVLLVLAALPWIGADLGIYFNQTALGSVFQTGELRHQPGVAGLHPAVHHGHHHGMDGTLLVLTALLLSRQLRGMRRPLLRNALGAYLSLMLVYGVANAAQDFWLEQGVKRGWTTRGLPNVLEPKASVAWGAMIVAAALVWALVSRTPLARPASPS